MGRIVVIAPPGRVAFFVGILMTILIFANGDLPETAWVKPLLERATLVIAADGGAWHVERLGSRPGIIIGDLDSYPREKIQPGTQIISYPAAKDETDLELALLYALENYDEPIEVIGAFGGRVDQMLANMLLLAHPLALSRPVSLRSQHQTLWLVTNYSEIKGETGDTVSLIPLKGEVLVQETMGLKWPLHNSVLAFGPARGISNALTQPTASLTIAEGYLFCIHTRQTWQR